MLPGLVKTQSQQVEEEKIKKEAKVINPLLARTRPLYLCDHTLQAPPPGKKAQAKFNFDGKNEK